MTTQEAPTPEPLREAHAIYYGKGNIIQAIADALQQRDTSHARALAEERGRVMEIIAAHFDNLSMTTEMQEAARWYKGTARIVRSLKSSTVAEKGVTSE